MKKTTEKFMNGMNYFNKLIFAKIKKQYIPFMLYFLITERCNLKCSYCWIRRSEDVISKELSTDSIIKTINDFHVMGTRYISVIGGEPLLRNDLNQIITHINKLKMMNDIITNGLLIHTQIEALKKFNLVCISLEGNDETHDNDRGRGTYAKIIKNIELLKKHKIRFRFNTTITQSTVKSFKHIVMLAKKYEASVAVAMAIVSPCKINEIVPDVDTVRNFWKEVRTLKISGYPIEKSLSAIDTLIRNSHFFSESKIYENELPSGYGIQSCTYGKYICYFGSDGIIFPCCHPEIYGKKEFNSNIFEHGTVKAWQNVVNNTRCKFCSMILGCETNSFFNLSIKSLFESAHSLIFHR